MNKGIVVTGHKITSEAGYTILNAGGNAYDAMIASFITSCVVESSSISLGGGGFMLAVPQDKPPKVLDFFTQTPLVKKPEKELDFSPITVDYKDSSQTFHIGLGAVATPGNVAAIFEIHEQYGSMPLKELASLAIETAKGSWEVDNFQAIGIDLLYPILAHKPEQANIYTNENGTKKKAGDELHIPYLANAIEAIIYEGKRAFYEGEFAQKLIADCQEKGGYLTLKDLKNYTVEQRKPITFSYKNNTILTNPPPGSGGLLIAFALKLLEKSKLSSLKFGSKEHLELLAQNMKNVGEARKNLIDGKVLNQQLLNNFLSEKTIKQYLKPSLSKIGSTTHISIIDKDGNAACLTHSSGEGSGYVIPKTGIMMNNMLGEADLMPLGFHNFPTNARISSMMSPTIVQDKQGIKAIIGSGGANRIRAAILQTIVNLIDFEMDLATAIESPRVHLEENDLHLEGAFHKKIVDNLALGNLQKNFWDQDKHMFFGGVNAIARQGNTFVGHGDSRRFGVAKTLQ